MGNMNEGKVIMLVEDDQDILWGNQQVLKEEGYTVITAETIADLFIGLDTTPPDLIILDLKLPDGNSLDFMPEIRAKTSVPILILTANVERNTRLAGLKAGGDDYITKPFDIDELCQRVAAFFRREDMHSSKPPADKYICGLLMFDLLANQAYVSGVSMELSGKEFAFLHLFARNEEKTLPNEFIYETIWKQKMLAEDQSVRNTVHRLRKKLESSKSGYDIVSTKGEGYTFIKG